MSRQGRIAGHVFISYVREDSQRVDQLQGMLQGAGIPVWRDTADLWPGEDWRIKIRRAITDNALVFIACFSYAGLARRESYQNEELNVAIEQLRRRRPEDPWLIPVRFDECRIPDWEIGAGRTLASIQRADLFGERMEKDASRLVASVLRILGRTAAPSQARNLSRTGEPSTSSPGKLLDSSSFPPHVRNAILGRLLGLEVLAPNISLIEAQGGRDIAERLLNRLNWVTSEAFDDPDHAEPVEQFLRRLVSALRAEFSKSGQGDMTRTGYVLDALADLVEAFVAAPYDPLTRLADAAAETAADYYRVFQADVPERLWWSTGLNFFFAEGMSTLPFDSRIHIQISTEFGSDDHPAAQVAVKISPRWLNQETIAALPGLLLHEYIAHVPQGPFDKRRRPPGAGDVFAEGWMDYIAYRVLKDALERRGPSQALEAALIPSWATLYESAASRVFGAPNPPADADRTASLRFEGVTAAQQLHDLLRQLPETAEAADEFLYRLSFSLNVSRFDNASRVRFAANVRHQLQRASSADAVVVPLRDWAAGHIGSDELFERIMA